jgi:transcription initiation factor IIE alpha subunit
MSDEKNNKDRMRIRWRIKQEERERKITRRKTKMSRSLEGKLLSEHSSHNVFTTKGAAR